MRFYLGKEAVPRHRLQALLAKGDFDQALELARAFNMDENDVHAARLLALLREAGSVSSGISHIRWKASALAGDASEDCNALRFRLEV